MSLTTGRGDKSLFKGLFIFGYVIMSVNAAAFVLALFLIPKKTPSFLKAYEFVVQTGLFLLYALALFTLRHFVDATENAVLVLPDESWYLLSTPIKLVLAYIGFSNAFTQIATCIYSLEWFGKESFYREDDEPPA